MYNGLKFTPEGRPLKPGSIFHGIKRSRLPTEEEVMDSLYQHKRLTISYQWYSQLESIVCTVGQVRIFTDGVLLLLNVDTSLSPLKWPQAPVWVPTDVTQTSGVLATWVH